MDLQLANPRVKEITVEYRNYLVINLFRGVSVCRLIELDLPPTDCDLQMIDDDARKIVTGLFALPGVTKVYLGNSVLGVWLAPLFPEIIGMETYKAAVTDVIENPDSRVPVILPEPPIHIAEHCWSYGEGISVNLLHRLCRSQGEDFGHPSRAEGNCQNLEHLGKALVGKLRWKLGVDHILVRPYWIGVGGAAKRENLQTITEVLETKLGGIVLKHRLPSQLQISNS